MQKNILAHCQNKQRHTLCPNKSLMLSMPYNIIVGLQETIHLGFLQLFSINSTVLPYAEQSGYQHKAVSRATKGDVTSAVAITTTQKVCNVCSRTREIFSGLTHQKLLPNCYHWRAAMLAPQAALPSTVISQHTVSYTFLQQAKAELAAAAST